MNALKVLTQLFQGQGLNTLWHFNLFAALHNTVTNIALTRLIYSNH